MKIKNRLLQLKNRCKKDRVIHIFNTLSKWSPCNIMFESQEITDKFIENLNVKDYTIDSERKDNKGIYLGIEW